MSNVIYISDFKKKSDPLKNIKLSKKHIQVLHEHQRRINILIKNLRDLANDPTTSSSENHNVKD